MLCVFLPVLFYLQLKLPQSQDNPQLVVEIMVKASKLRIFDNSLDVWTV